MINEKAMVDFKETTLTEEEIDRCIEEHKEEIVYAMIQAKKDMKNGDYGRPWREVLNEIGEKYGI